ncbi:MAG TPA: BamA/TamA family outer membrane protein [Bryobacteraceae bacterium]
MIKYVVPPALALIAASAYAQPQTFDPGPHTFDPKIDACIGPDNCIRLTGGYSSLAGSFAGLSYTTRNLSLSSEYGVRLRRVQLSFDKASLFGKPIETGAAVYGQRFHYNQGRESSIFAFERNIPEFNETGKDNLLNYISHSYGVAGFVQFPIRNSSHFRVTYTYDVSDFTTLTAATGDYFGNLDFQGGGPAVLKDIRTSKLIPSFAYDTVDHPIHPTRGAAAAISTAIAGLGDVHTIEPSVDAKYFRSGFKKGHAIGMHLSGRALFGYGIRVPPPFSRYYIGGENDVRGFDSWSIGPAAYMPSTTSVNVLNNDGSPRLQPVMVNGVRTLVNITQTVPTYRTVNAGGDTNIVTNFEYRIPLTEPFTLALFADAGMNRLSFPGHLRLNWVRANQLNSQFPQAGFTGLFPVQPGTQTIRMSTGAELRVRVPRIDAPLRFYVAYNPLGFRGFLKPPPSFDRSYFPNNATFVNASNTVGAPMPLRERHFTFRFSIGRTF